MPLLDTVQELPRTILPLKSVRYNFIVQGGLAEVEMIQVYYQDNAKPLDCEYLFPLPADGAVYRCEATINGRVNRARIEEREAALKIVEARKAEGQRTALVESERDNLFTLSLGNIQSHDLIEIKLAYMQPIRQLAGQITFDLPLCPGVRYIPGKALLRSNRGSGVENDTDQVPDASRITSPRIDAEHPDAAFIELQGQVESKFVDGEIISPSHNLKVTKIGDYYDLTFANGGIAPDCDLAFRWKERETDQPELRGWVSTHEDYSYALIELRAPANVEPSGDISQDVYFVVDRSGSMKGAKWEKAIAALHGCVQVLNSNDRVSVTLFGSTFQDFGSEPARPAALMADARFRQLDVLIRPDGGTQMEPALRHVVDAAEKYSKDRSAVLVLITDAEIGNEREIVALMRQHPSLPVHCFGIDTTLNDSLLLDLVRQQGGTFRALQPNEDVTAVVTQLGKTLRQPVLLNLQVAGGWELAVGSVPNLYAGQVHSVSIRSNQDLAANAVKVLARNRQDHNIEVEFALTPTVGVGPRLRWCKERIIALMAKQNITEAISLSKESNLLCPLTAFVAWDELEKVFVANRRLIQPAMDLRQTVGTRGATGYGKMSSSVHFMSPVFRAARASSSVMRLCAPNAAAEFKDTWENGKLLTQKRIQELLTVVSGTRFGNGYVNKLRLLEDWVNQSALLNNLWETLAACENKIKRWAICERELAKLINMIVDETAQFSSAISNFLNQPHADSSSLQHFSENVSRFYSSDLDREINSKIGEMTRLETEATDLIEKFLFDHKE